MSESAPSLPRIPGYELIDRLGGGGQASVYRGVQTSMNRPVAVKIIPEGHPDHAAEVGRFLREARLLAKLRHDNIVQAIDFGENEGIRYLVMEFIEGTAVNLLLKQEGHLGIERSLDIALQVCRALDHAAKFDVIHRDIKPANVVITPEGRAVVVDFGLARPEDSDVEVTRAGIAMGTPHYMAPEQIKGEVKLDPRVDIYALGGTLFHMLTGKVPFSASGKMQVLMCHLRDPLVIPTDPPEPVPPRVFDIVRRAMEKERDERYPTAHEMLADLISARESLATGGPPRAAASPIRPDALAEQQLREASRLLEERTLLLDAAESRATDLTARLEELERRRARRDGAAEVDPRRLAVLTHERDELRERLVAAREAVDRIAEKAHEEKEVLATRATVLDRELRSLREERESLDQRLRAVQQERRRAEETAEAARRRQEQVSEESQNLRLARDALAEQVESLAVEVERARGASRVIDGEDDGLTTSIEKLRHERAELTDKVSALEAEVEEARGETQEVGTAAAAREEELSRLRAERDELASRFEEFAQDPGQIEDLTREVSEQERRAVEATTALAEEKRRAQDERTKLEGECEALREKLAAARGEAEQALSRSRKLAAESQEIRREIEQTRSDLEARVENLTSERDAYASEVRELTSRIEVPTPEAASVYASVEPLSEPARKEAREATMVRIPAGFFIAGEDEGQEVEKPRRRVRLHTFDIDVYLVTNRQYEHFVRDGGVVPPDHWDGDVPPDDIVDHPVVRVTWEEAVAYAAWIGKRLPTLLEWQRAARGTDGRSFPWGEHEDVSRLNCKEATIRSTTPVGSYPEGVSPDHIHDMAGNVTEWVHGRFAAPASGDPDAVIRPVCGGSWRDSISRSRCAARRGYPDGMRAYYVGFRCAGDVE